MNTSILKVCFNYTSEFKDRYISLESLLQAYFRSSHLELFLRIGVLKLCRKFTGEHRYRSVISIKLLCKFIEITFRHGCSPLNLLHIFRTPFPRNTSWWLLLILLRFQNKYVNIESLFQVYF